jgi:hypothetical protein
MIAATMYAMQSMFHISLQAVPGQQVLKRIMITAN